MFIKDNYTPIFFKDYIIHKNLTPKLINLLHFDLPHIIFYGPNSCGKTTLCKSFISELYNTKIETIKKKFTIKILNNTKDIYINQSEYYFEILIDKYLIYNKQYLINLIISLTETNDINEACLYKIIVIKNIDLLPIDFYLFIKNTIEKKYNTIRFIFITSNISKIKLYKSFFLLFKVNEAKKEEKIQLINHIIKDRKIKVNIDIDNLSNNNLINMILKFELLLFNNSYIFQEDLFIEKIIKLIEEKKINNIIVLREILYEIMALNINFKPILNKILKMFLQKKLSSNTKYNIIELYSKYNTKSIKSYKNVIIIESLLVNIMSIL
jgi:replication factor C subunit 3/5